MKSEGLISPSYRLLYLLIKAAYSVDSNPHLLRALLTIAAFNIIIIIVLVIIIIFNFLNVTRETEFLAPVIRQPKELYVINTPLRSASSIIIIIIIVIFYYRTSDKSSIYSNSFEFSQ